MPIKLDDTRTSRSADLMVLVPSRGRPQAARELAQAFISTVSADTTLVFVVDEDDPTLPEYSDIVRQFYRPDASYPRINVCMGENDSHTMVEALNKAAMFLAGDRNPPFALGFMGDDHRPRTIGWDMSYLGALQSPGIHIVYGDDLLQRRNLPTQCAMTTELVKTLGFMAPPMLRHMYVDNFWLDLGRQAACIQYLSDVVVEHMHPVAGKADWDEGHKRVNSSEVFKADEKAYNDFKSGARWPQIVFAVQQMIQSRLRSQVDEAAQRIAHRKQLGAFSRQPESRGGYPVEKIEGNATTHEWRLFPEGTIPEYTTAEWYEGREHAPHIDQPVHRDRLHASATFVAQAAFQSRLHTVVDLGCGDGGLLTLLGPRLKGWGYDLSPENVEAAALRGVDVRYGDALGEGVEWGQIAVATEMLEHLVDPHAFVAKIFKHSEALVCSSPWDERPGTAYEFHAWAWDLEGYRALVEGAGWKVLRQRKVHRFQVILAVKP